MSLSAYRGLWRATGLAFQCDERLLLEARNRIRQSFREQSHLTPGDPALQPAIQQALDVAKVLRENVVQGRSDGGDTYKLRIHKETERGDNESIKYAGSGEATGGCCQN